MSSVAAWTKMAEDSQLHDIHAILQRPIKILDGEFDTGFISNFIKFPDAILTNSANVVDKLNYFTFFRANVKVKLIFNATPFMSGRYWMYFSPFDDVSNRGARSDLPNATGYPGIEIDLASGAPVEIKIPYCAPLSHYNLLDTHSNMGELRLIPLNGIQTDAGSVPPGSGAPFTIFAWFEDIELALPTSLPVTVPFLADEVLDAQISEEAQATSGPKISGVLSTVSSVAGNVASAIPRLGRWARPVEWVTRAASGALESFGWNKPVSLSPVCPYANTPAKGYTNMTGIDNSSKLAAAPDNGLTYESGIFSTDVDEMDISYVTKKSCIFRSGVNWATNNFPGDTLFESVVYPGICNGSASSLNPTTLAFVSSMFRYWRGGLKYRLTVAKTAFHTGRLRITFHPGVHTSSLSFVYENAYNWILDLSVTSELEFEIPYASNVPWKEVIVTEWDDSFNLTKEKFSTGYLTITVLTPLRAASTAVADNCPINLWISGGDDFALSIPDFGNYAIGTSNLAVEDEVFEAQVFNETSSSVNHNEQVVNTASQVFPMSKMSFAGAEELCMGEKVTNLRQIIKRFGITSHGKAWPYEETINSNHRCYPGPMPLNVDTYLFNQLELDPCYFGVSNAGSVVNSQTITLPAYRLSDGTLFEGTFTAADHFPITCPLYYVSFLYRFFRGGRRYKIVNAVSGNVKSTTGGWQATSNHSSDTQNIYTQQLDAMEFENKRSNDPLIVKRDWQIIENGDLDGPAISTFISNDVSPTFEHYVYPDLNGTLEFEVPYYGQTPISLVGEGNISDTEGPLVRRSKVFIRRNVDPRGMDRPIFRATSNYPYLSGWGDMGGFRPCFGAYTLYEAAADDFSFGYLVGAPRITRIRNIP